MSSFDIYKKITSPQESRATRFDTVDKNKQNIKSNALKGFLLNNYIKKDEPNLDEDSFDYILQAPPQTDYKPTYTPRTTQSAFNAKKAIMPVVITTCATILTVLAISICSEKYSKKMAIQPNKIGFNRNLVEEEDFAMYNFLRDPNSKTFLGLLAVGGFSLLTLSAKTLVDGLKNVWIKKQECDIRYDLEENLIEVEKEAFQGKINISNTLLNDCANYFKSSLNPNNKDVESNKILTFKGNEEQKNQKEKNEKYLKIKPLMIAGLSVVAFCSILFLTFKSYQKTAGNLKEYMNKIDDKQIKKQIDEIQQMADKDKALNKLTELFKSITISIEAARSELTKITNDKDKIAKALAEIEDTRIFDEASSAMSGKKINYYCYINQTKGDLYNWILNPENKWNKYLFISLSFISSLSYIAEAAADAVKQVTVSRENSKSELNLRKRLVAVEVDNFKAKKISAIQPMIDNFDFQKKKGKSKQDLTTLAQNILIEIKNGPPFIYS